MLVFSKDQLFLVIISSLVIAACSDSLEFENPNLNENSNEKSYPNVDQQLWSYFSNFELEAASRGVFIDLSNRDLVTAEIDQIPDDGVAGTCHFGSYIQNHITIDQAFWNNSSSTWREFVVFHELGHCALLRGHYEGTDHNGNCLSIMASGTEDCNPIYNATTRTNYLDELFFNH